MITAANVLLQIRRLVTSIVTDESPDESRSYMARLSSTQSVDARGRAEPERTSVSAPEMKDQVSMAWVMSFVCVRC